MHLSGQQQPSMTQQEGVILSTMLTEAFTVNADDDFALEEVTEQSTESQATLPASTLAMLETRLHSMTSMINNLNVRNIELRKVIKDRDARLVQMEQENAVLDQQLTLFSATNGQVIAGLANILQRFPIGEDLRDEEEEDYYALLADAELFDETVGSA